MPRSPRSRPRRARPRLPRARSRPARVRHAGVTRAVGRRHRVKPPTPFDWLVVGLGNPGKEFARTRHNVGEEVVVELARRRGDTLQAAAGTTRWSPSRRIGDERCVLAFPLTYMNDSGLAVRALARRYRIEEPTTSSSSTTSSTCRRRRCGSRSAAASPATTGCAASPSTSAPRTSCGCASASASRRRKERGGDHVLPASRPSSASCSTWPCRRPPMPSSHRHRQRRRRHARLQVATPRHGSRCRRVTPSGGWPSGSTGASPASAAPVRSPATPA